MEGVLLGLLPGQCNAWKEDYSKTIDSNESLYGMPRPGYEGPRRSSGRCKRPCSL